MLHPLTMEQRARPAVGHYAALGVEPGATSRAIEIAFAAWRRRQSTGVVDAEAYRRAEDAYHVLAHPLARDCHDRQLGLKPHPAWSAAGESAARAGLRQAVALLDRGRPGPARALLEQAVDALPDDPLARSYLAVALARTRGSLHEAARHARHAVARKPREAAFLFNLAEVYAAAGLTRRSLATRVAAWRAAAQSLFTGPPRPPA